MNKVNTAFLLSSVALLCAVGAAQAQTVYRIVGADGKVTFSDKPPVDAKQGKIATTGVGAGAASSNSSLPFELRKVATKYPVVLYAAASCAPCDSGRSLLISRGVPFNERSVITNEDRAALQRQMGDTSLPYLTVGGQRIRGMSESQWTEYLDAAGYPKTSQLPAGYENAAPTPLVPLPTGSPAAKAVEKAAPVAVEPAYQPPAVKNPANPAGIKF